MADKEVARKTEERALQLRPLCNICEEDGKVVLRLEMPGVEKEYLNLTIDNNQLLITGKRPAVAVEGEFLLKERPVGDYIQIYNLDETIDHEKVDASLEKGILTVTLHLKEQVKPRQITVKSE